MGVMVANLPDGVYPVDVKISDAKFVAEDGTTTVSLLVGVKLLMTIRNGARWNYSILKCLKYAKVFLRLLINLRRRALGAIRATTKSAET
jgi:hypothetical protein